MSQSYDVVLTFDGITEPVNPSGYGAWGFVIYLGTKKKICEYGCLGNPDWMTNNYAEYCALGFALKKMVELNLDLTSFTILGDSNLVCNQIRGDWSLKSERLIPLHGRCMEYLEIIEKSLKGKPWAIRWIPRDINFEADEMSRQGYRDFTKSDPPERHKK